MSDTTFVSVATTAPGNGLSHSDNVYLMRVEGFAYLALTACVCIVFIFSFLSPPNYVAQIRLPFVNENTNWAKIRSYITRADGLIVIIFMYILSIQTARYSFTRVTADFVRICDIANVFVLLMFLRSFLSRSNKLVNNVVLFMRSIGLAAISATLYFNELKEDGSLHGRIADDTGVALSVCTAVGIIIVGFASFYHFIMFDDNKDHFKFKKFDEIEKRTGAEAPFLIVTLFDVVYLTSVTLLVYVMILTGNLTDNNLWYTVAFFIPPTSLFLVWIYTTVNLIMARGKGLYNFWMQTMLTFALTVLAFTMYKQHGVGEMTMESRFAMWFQVAVYTGTALFWLIPIVWFDEVQVAVTTADAVVSDEAIPMDVEYNSSKLV